MLRPALVLALVFATTGTAAAAKRKVQIVSKPAGASVYVGSIEAGEKCKTPCAVDVEVPGETTVIIDLAGYRPKSDQIVVGRRERAPKRTYTMIPSVGTLKIEGPPGANVFVDGADKGKIPFEQEVAAGPHQVHVKLDGKEIYVNAVDVAEDEELKITVANRVAIKPPDDDPPDEDVPTDKPEIREKAKPAAPRTGSLFQLSAAFSVGFRDFTYRNVNPMTTRTDLGPESEGGQVLAGGQLELWPGTLLGLRPLRGFALVGRFQYGINPQTVIDADDTALGARTFWTSLEVSARQQFVIAGKVIAEIGVGYVGDQHQFEGAEGDIAKVPDAHYQSLKIGGRGALILGSAEPYLAVENRIVMSAGPLQQRFDATGGADVSGLRGAAGVNVRFGKLAGRLEASLTRYSWNIVDNGTTDTDGATDSIKQVSMSVGYAY
jgi:hypothetical protein